MKDDCTLLNHIRQTTEMGADGIDSVLPYTNGEFRQALKQQRTEYKKFMIPPILCCKSSAASQKMSARSPNGPAN